MAMSGSSSRPRSSGFSLIEVLIAVVVLSVGMLAMAALQGSLTRASVDAKNRTYALNILHDELDSRRALIEEVPAEYETLASTGPTTAVGPDGMGSYTLTTTVTRFVSSADPAICGATPAPCFVQRNDNLNPRQGPEFKRVEVSVAWTDAANRDLTLSLSDVFSSVPAVASRELLDRSIQVGGAAGPRVRIRPPSDIGVIPIAVGDGSEATAASNPRPTLHDRGYTDKTSFEVFQYRPYGNNEALLSQKIEIVSVGCTCQLTAPQQQNLAETDLFFAQPREPLYWNGTSYGGGDLAPKTRRQGRPAAGVIQDVNLCTTCCSDHHDHLLGKVKLDSYRPASDYSGGNHNHYPRDGLVPVSSGQQYHEVCRMIRKDGFMMVATDARLAQMNLLETDIERSRSLKTAVPKTAVVGRYQEFVRDYLVGKLLGLGDPNTTDPLTESMKSDYFDLLELPRTISMQVTDPNYYLHDRGLLLDYLEKEALDEIKDAIDKCPGSGDDALLDCILLKLPIVTLNATDIAQWRSEADKNYVTVTNMARNANVVRFDDTTTGAGLGNRGIVRARAAGGEDVTVRMGRSNSGLADVNPTDPCDAGKNDGGWSCAGEILEDVQAFCVGGDCGNQNQGGAPFYVNVSSSDPQFTKAGLGLTWLISGLDAGSCSNAEEANKDYRCVVAEYVELPKTVNLTVNGYNRRYQKSYPRPAGCGGSPTVQGWVCVNYRLASASVDGNALSVPNPTGDDGYANEETTVSGPVNNGSTFELLFEKQGEIERTPRCDTSVNPKKTVIPTCDSKDSVQ
jgi:prepilin-type N-terminal cleavage/methylation domain-containing protein